MSRFSWYGEGVPGASLEELGDKTIVFSGVMQTTTKACVEEAKALKSLGVHGLFLMPPIGTIDIVAAWDPEKNPEVWIDQLRTIADAVNLPVIIHPTGGKFFAAPAMPLGPWTLEGVQLSIGVIPWPVVFISTDLINEYYGKEGVRKLTLLAVGMIAYCFLLLFVTMAIPASIGTTALISDTLPSRQIAVIVKPLSVEYPARAPSAFQPGCPM